MFKVSFVVHDTSKSSPFAIRVVGNLPALGNWNPINGFQMEEYYEGDWESIRQIEIPQGQEFQFKLVKLLGGNAVQWEQLPNNSNRKFKPKFNTKLVLKWSDHMGQALNEAKSSMKLKGLPGVMVNGRKQGGLLKRDPKKNKKNIFSDSDSQNENQNDSFCVPRKKSSDIRQTINSGDIEQIYYDTTELENAYHSYKQIQVFLVSNKPSLKKQFVQRIQEQLKQLHELENFKFKWLLLADDESSPPKSKKISFKKLESSQHGKIYLEDYAMKNVQRNHFIFVDLDAALKTVVGNTSACLYLPSEEFQKAIKYLKDLEKFQLICFDSPKANKNLLKIFQEKRTENKKSDVTKIKLEEQRKSDLPKSQKNLDSINLQKILEQLEFCQIETSVSTMHSFTRSEARANIVKPNSILIIESQIMKTDKKFFDQLLDQDCEKRLIIIIHKGPAPQWIHNYSQSKNICVILDNFNKLYFVGKLYDPSKKHRNAIQFIQMRARLFEKQFGGSWSITDNTFIFQFENQTISKAKNIKAQIQNVLMKDYNYFKFHMKENKLKITWNLSHPVRLLRTLLRIKVIEEGQMGNFYIVSQNENFNELKQQLRLLINTKSELMLEHKNTKIYDFGYGTNTTAKFSIKTSGAPNCESSSSTSSNLSQKQNNPKMVEFLQKKFSRSSAVEKSIQKSEKLRGSDSD